MDATKDLSAALEAHGEALAAEMQALEDMPQVKLTPASVFDRAKPAGTKAQQRGVICQLRCCGGQLDRRCNDLTGDKACPTHVEAARKLRAKVVEKHGSEECVAKARQKLAEEGGEQTVFSVMMSAQLSRQRADSELKQAEDELRSLQSKVAPGPTHNQRPKQALGLAAACSPPHSFFLACRRVEHAWDPLTGSMSSFSYMMLAKDQLARRESTCWCEGCFGARGRLNMTSSRDKLICPSCTHRDKPVWVQQVVKDLGTGLAGRRTEAQAAGKKLAQMLMQPSNTTPKPNEGFLAIQARERWSTSEEVHLRPGHFWLAQLPLEREVRKIEKRTTIEGVIFHPGDYLIRIGRYFDRVASDTSGLTFEEWTPPDGGSFVVNATELRAVNFTMTPTKPPPPLVEVRRSGRRAAVVSTPPQKPPKEYTMDPAVDNDIRSRCW